MPRNQSKRIQWLLFCATVVLVVLAWLRVFHVQPESTPAQFVLSGKTMGTTYSIRFFADQTPAQQTALQQRIDEELARINHLMSSYDPESEISRFNRSTSVDFITVSPDFLSVMTLALQVVEKTGGAFDPSVAALVNLWGFGPDGRITEPPDEQAVLSARQRCGWQHLTLGDGQLRKDIPDLRLDLAAIAKGYGVDAVGRVIASSGISNYVVEIGGETTCSGTKPSGALWRIGLQKPKFHADPGDALAGYLEITDLAVATSGDYQNFFTDRQGNIYSHIMDPRTGRPVDHATASVTVVAPTCAEADALATGLYVMGAEEGLALVETLPGVEALFIVREPDGSFVEKVSSGFRELTRYQAFVP